MFPKVLIVSGFLVLLFGSHLVVERYSPKRLEFKNFSGQMVNSSKQLPVRLIIPSLGIDNSIFKADINDGKWESTKEGVSYLSSTPLPGSQGNSVMYGHNFPNLLGKLNKIKTGEKIEIMMADGKVKVFVVEYTSVVDPSQTHILDQTTDTRITIYTCTGFLDSKRFVVTALLDK